MQSNADRRDDDRELALLRSQDPDAFARMVGEHQRIVLGLAQSRGLRGADIDDAAAEVFASVWRSLPRFEGRASLATWVYRIAARVMEKHRARLARPERALELRDPPDLRASPHDQSEEGERDRLIWDAVASLESRQALAVEMFYRRGWSIAQVSEAIGCPAATAKTLLFRAREELRQKLLNKGIAR